MTDSRRSRPRRQRQQAFSERAAGEIEIVRVLIVAQQDCIDPADPDGWNRRTFGFSKDDRPRLVRGGIVEGGIGEEPESGDLDDRRGASNVCDRNGRRCAHQGHVVVSSRFDIIDLADPSGQWQNCHL